MLKIEGLTVKRKGSESLRGVDLTVETGSICGLVGGAGSGKDTLLRAVCGLVRPQAGTVEWDGEDLLHGRGVLRRLVSFIPWTREGVDHMTVAEYAEYCAQMCGYEGFSARSRAMEALAYVGLEPVAREMSLDLGRTDNRALAFARCIIERPRLLVIEEWETSGWMERGMTPAAALTEAAAGGTTVLLSSSSAAAVADFCTHLAVMRDGRILLSGTPREFRTRMSSGYAWEVRVSSDADRAETLLSELPQVRSLSRSGGRLAIHLEKDARPEELLAYLVREGLPVTHFARRTTDLDGELQTLLGPQRKVVSRSEA